MYGQVSQHSFKVMEHCIERYIIAIIFIDLDVDLNSTSYSLKDIIKGVSVNYFELFTKISFECELNLCCQHVL